MTARERVRAVLSGGVPDRVPYHDWYWASTVERWRREGMPRDTTPEEYFGCDICVIGQGAGWLTSSPQFDDSLQLPVQVLEETERHRLFVDENGATRKHMRDGSESAYAWIDFTIKNRDDWERMKPRAAFGPSRIPEGVLAPYEEGRRAEKFVAFLIHGCFHPAWQKVGMENLLVWMHEDPELVTDLFATQVRLVTDIYEAAKSMGMEFDGAWVLDDLGYRTAPLVSPAMYRELVMPHHARLCERFAEDGLKTILHSDGHVVPLIPAFLDAGFGALHPLEAKAGCDVRELKPEYGDRLALFGNIDARKLAGSREEIEEEVRSKVAAGKVGNGYLFHTDHSVPPDVSLENYRFAMEVLERCGGYE